MNWRERIDLYILEGRTVSGGKVSDAEKQAQQQSAQEATYLQSMMKTQFAEQQGLLNNVLLPQLQQMATNPQGFGAKALSAMQSQLINTVGTQLSSQEKSVQSQFATQNMAGLSSGVQAAIQANLAQGAAGQEAGGLQNLSIANAQLQNQQQQFGLTGLGQATSLLGAAPQSAGLGISANNAAFGQASQMAQQGSIWQNLLGGVLGAGLNFATGGLSKLGGNIFGGGGGQAQPTSGGTIADTGLGGQTTLG
jgi:hypothetical protein